MSVDSPYKLVHVPALLGHLPGDLVSAHGVIIRLLAEAEVVSQVDQGHGDTEPHAEQGQHGGEGDLVGQGAEGEVQQSMSVLIIFH